MDTRTVYSIYRLAVGLISSFSKSSLLLTSLPPFLLINMRFRWDTFLMKNNIAKYTKSSVNIFISPNYNETACINYWSLDLLRKTKVHFYYVIGLIALKLRFIKLDHVCCQQDRGGLGCYQFNSIGGIYSLEVIYSFHYKLSKRKHSQLPHKTGSSSTNEGIKSILTILLR